MSMKCLTLLQMLERAARSRKAGFLPLSGSTNAIWTIAGADTCAGLIRAEAETLKTDAEWAVWGRGSV
jgi:hypothetical protein